MLVLTLISHILTLENKYIFRLISMPLYLTVCWFCYTKLHVDQSHSLTNLVKYQLMIWQSQVFGNSFHWLTWKKLLLALFEQLISYHKIENCIQLMDFYITTETKLYGLAVRATRWWMIMIVLFDSCEELICSEKEHYVVTYNLWARPIVTM